MEMNTPNSQPQSSPVFSENKPNQNIISNQRGNFILIIGMIILVLVIGVGAYILGTKANKNPDVTSQVVTQTGPTQPLEEKNSKQIATSERIYYADNGFSFYYPDSLEMSQAYQDAIQWKPKNANRIENEDGLDALTLHESTSPLSTIKAQGKYTIWNKGYPDARAEIVVSNVQEESVSIGQNTTKLYKINCGNNCQYGIVRFESNKKYYEFIYNLSKGNINEFKEILASLSFFDPNVKEWKTFTSKEGGYTVQYPASSTVLEKVFTSVDGVRGYNGNSFKIFPPNSSPILDAFSVSYETVGNKTLDEYLKENQCGTIDQKKRFTLNGEPAEYQSTACGIAGSSDVYVKHKDKLYTIGVSSPDDPILAKFKFID